MNKDQYYKNIHRDIAQEQKEFEQIGKERLSEIGITFSVFKKRLYELLYISPGRSINSYYLFRSFCYEAGNIKPEYFKEVTMDGFINQEFSDFEMSTHGIRLKTKPDDRL